MFISLSLNCSDTGALPGRADSSAPRRHPGQDAALRLGAPPPSGLMPYLCGGSWSPSTCLRSGPPEEQRKSCVKDVTYHFHSCAISSDFVMWPHSEEGSLAGWSCVPMTKRKGQTGSWGQWASLLHRQDPRDRSLSPWPSPQPLGASWWRGGWGGTLPSASAELGTQKGAAVTAVFLWPVSQ